MTVDEIKPSIIYKMLQGFIRFQISSPEWAAIEVNIMKDYPTFFHVINKANRPVNVCILHVLHIACNMDVAVKPVF